MKEELLEDKVIKTGNAISIRFMADWLGIPFVAGGSSRAGVDCAQLCKRFFHLIDKELLLPEKYPFDPVQQTFVVREWRRKNSHLAFHKYKHRMLHDLIITQSHLGILLTKDVMIHAQEKKGKVVLTGLGMYHEVYSIFGR